MRVESVGSGIKVLFLELQSTIWVPPRLETTVIAGYLSEGYLCRGPCLGGTPSQRCLRFLGKWQSGCITGNTNKPWGINDEALDVFLLYFFHLMGVRGNGEGLKKRDFYYCPFANLPVNGHSLVFFFFKLKTHLHKTAPDTVAPDRGDRKMFTRHCWLPPWATHWMSAPHHPEKNDALYSDCMRPFIANNLATDSSYDQLGSSGTELVLIHS